MKDIWLIRHAESMANVGAATPTPSEIPLTDKGFWQANELGRALPSRPDLVVVSPFVRTQQTAEPFLQRIDKMRVEVLDVQEFTYLSTERCRNTTYLERKPLVAEFWQRNDPSYCDGGNAESFAEFIGRVDRFIDYVRDEETRLAYVFTHEQFIKGLMFRVYFENATVDANFMSGFCQFMNSFKVSNVAVIRSLLDAEARLLLGKIDDSLIKRDA